MLNGMSCPRQIRLGEKKTALALSLLVTFGAAAYAGKKDIKSLKNLAIVKCDAGDVGIGRKGKNGVALSSQKLVNQIYDETVKQLTAAGLKIAESETVEKAVSEASGESAEQKEAKMNEKMQAMQSNPAMANLPPEVAAMMQQGMMGSMQSGKDMATKIDADKKAKEEKNEIYEVPADNSGGFSTGKSHTAEQVKEISKISGWGDAYSRKNKNDRSNAVRFFKALDQSGADGYVLLYPDFYVQGDEARVVIDAYFCNADGKKIYERNTRGPSGHFSGWKKTWGTSKIKAGRDTIFSELKYSAEDAKTALQSAIPEAVQKLVEDLELK